VLDQDSTRIGFLCANNKDGELDYSIFTRSANLHHRPRSGHRREKSNIAEDDGVALADYPRVWWNDNVELTLYTP